MTRDGVERLEVNLISCDHERIVIDLNQPGILECVRLTVCNDLIWDRLLLNTVTILIGRDYLLEGLRRLLRRWILDVVDSKLVCFACGADCEKFDGDNLA